MHHKEGLGWKHNKSEHVFITLHPLHGNLNPTHNVLSTYILLFYFTCFVNLTTKKPKNTSLDEVEPKPYVLANGSGGVWMRKTISEDHWEFPSCLGIRCCNFHPNIVKHACKSKPTWHKSKCFNPEPMFY